jgi:hypothetical protein
LISLRYCQQSSRIITVKSFIHEAKMQPFERLAALDFGTKNIGIAISDETKQLAFPSGTFRVKQPCKARESLIDLHRQLQAFSVKEKIRYLVNAILIAATD